MHCQQINNLKSALRGAIAVSLALAVAQWLHVDFSYWLVLSTIVIIQPNFGATMLRAKQRTISTVLGVSIGAMLAVLINNSLIAIFLLIPACFFLAIVTLPYRYSHAIFYITMGLMLILSHGAADTWGYVFMRIYDTVIGVVVGLICALLLWPSWAKNKLNDNILTSLNKCQHLFNLVTQCLISHDPNPTEVNLEKIALEDMIETNYLFLAEAQHEISFAQVKLAPASAIVTIIEKIASILNIFHMLSRIDIQYNAPERTLKRLQNLKQQTSLAFDTITEIIRNPNQTIDHQQIQAFEQLIQQTPDLETNASVEQRFLHRNINLLRIEMNHLFQASLLLGSPPDVL